MILRDPVHGLVSFETEESSIVPRLLGTREVQRLRRIRQLGLTSFAFPGAEHTRFSHAVGAAHVMQLLLARLRQIDQPLPFWQRPTSERGRDAIAAALLHDVGHGPFSHLFEAVLPGHVRHEVWTTRILLDPSSDVHRELAKGDAGLPQRVADLVCGKHDLPYLASAVSGTFDVDRCDYLLRDAHATRDALMSGRDETIDAMAQRLGIKRDYLSARMRLTYLAPDIVRVLVAGRLPDGLTPAGLLFMCKDLPHDWPLQRAALGLETP